MYEKPFRTQNLNRKINFYRFLRQGAEMMFEIERKSLGVNIGGSVTAVVGAGLVISGNMICLFYLQI